MSDPVEIDPIQQATWEAMHWEKKVRKHNNRENRLHRDAAKAKLKQLMAGSPI